MKKTASHLLAVVAVAALVSACGGGDEGVIVDEREPTPSGTAAILTVTSATEPTLNGIYSTNNVALNNVTKRNPIGGDPETCRFRFSGLVQGGSGPRLMDGDIRYIPGNSNLNATFISINAVEFRLVGTTGAQVDRNNNRVVYAGAVLTSTQATGGSITVTGAIPMLGDRPEGC